MYFLPRRPLFPVRVVPPVGSELLIGLEGHDTLAVILRLDVELAGGGDAAPGQTNERELVVVDEMSYSTGTGNVDRDLTVTQGERDEIFDRDDRLEPFVLLEPRFEVEAFVLRVIDDLDGEGTTELPLEVTLGLGIE